MALIKDHFINGIKDYWTQVCSGGGRVKIENSTIKLFYNFANSERYTDSQIDDYTLLGKRNYKWRPPLKLTVRAKASHKAATETTDVSDDDVLKGTAGFGFWNKPFTMQGDLFSLPESVWFFYSAPPSNMSLTNSNYGWGWKAQVVHARKISTLFYGVPLGISAIVSRVTNNNKYALTWMEKFSGASEKMVEVDIREWNTYKIIWKKNYIKFYINGKIFYTSHSVPKGPLGFVAWIDNEYAIAKPNGELKFGKDTITKPQYLEIDYINIKTYKK